jgi:hypothetical protein
LEALQRHYLQLNIGSPDDTILTSFGIPNFMFTEVIFGELISDVDDSGKSYHFEQGLPSIETIYRSATVGQP